jgi:para-aminobenzoate synthetase
VPGVVRSFGLRVAEIPAEVSGEAIHEARFGAAEQTFWLDSSRPGDRARFSYLGAATGPHAETIIHRVGEGAPDGASGGGLTDASEGASDGSIFDRLARRLAETRIDPAAGTDPASLPFEFTGGWVGWFGYELKAECGGAAAHRARTADAAWLFADRFFAIDHHRRRSYAVALFAADSPADDRAATQWVDEQRQLLEELAGRPDTASEIRSVHVDIEKWLVRPREQYLADIESVLGRLRAGESYEANLTDNVRLPFPSSTVGESGGEAGWAEDFAYYRRLRRLNPAPYAALLRLAGATVFSASPECFLSVGTDGTAESRPIKGTAPRDPEDPVRDEQLRIALATDPKCRAENLMIVDLLRNDLGRVCVPGSVTVPAFLVAERHPTVHQLVSTVRGRLRPEVGTVDCIRACFPGGSMTGAPKLRTMEITDALETEARGIYSGALGWLSLSGAAELSIVIRTAVRVGGELSVGAGGALVLDSDPSDEFAEMLLKADVPLRALPFAP